jgi:hypothetical protein
MAIYRMLQGAAFSPEGIKAMTTAYEDALQELKLTDRSDPSRLEIFWPAFAVGVGLLGVLVWSLFLGWLLGHALLAML